jgi:stage V sporulation protein S
MDIVRVSSSSPTAKVAGAIAGIMREKGHVAVQAIGATAVNQAVKALAVARSYLQEDGIEIAIIPEFVDIEIDNQERSVMKFWVERRLA